MSATENLSFHILTIFFGILGLVLWNNFSTLFLDRHGWRHRVAGLLHFIWLTLGLGLIYFSPAPAQVQVQVQAHSQIRTSYRYHSYRYHYIYVIYDVLLGIFGTTATLTAARDFPHKYIQNKQGQSGTLSQHAMVTQNEMLEHSFYQGLNLCQAIYLHFITTNTTTTTTAPIPSLHMSRTVTAILPLFLVTLPWYIRHRFPTHSFSANWHHQNQNKQTSVELFLYKIKKWQYIFYKHVLFHGINITTLFSLQQTTLTLTLTFPDFLDTIPLPLTHRWRIYWTALNTSYVLEFFLQSLVKRNILSQYSMMWLQRMLMTASTIAAINVLSWNGVAGGLYLGAVALTSMMLNFIYRGHDLRHTICLGFLINVLRYWMD